MMKKKSKAKVIAAAAAVVLITAALLTVFISQIYKEFIKPTEFEIVEPQSGAGTGYFRHCYEELNDVEKNFYAVVLQSIYSMPERIEAPTLEGGDLNKVFEALSFDNPDLFCIGRKSSAYAENNKIYFEPEYVMTKSEYDAKLAELNGVVNYIIQGASAYNTVYEIELYIHDYIVNNCTYTDPETDMFANDAYGCLVNHRAGCEGYSRAFQLVMNRLGFDVRLVTGEGADNGIDYIGHMWNYINIDGVGYFVDVTWDDPHSENDVLRHAYFNVNTADILLKHRNIVQSLPVCTSREYNYYIHEDAFVAQGRGENFEQALSRAISTARMRGYGCAEIRFSDANALELAKHTLFNDGIIYNVYTEAGILSGGDAAQVTYSTDKSLLTVCLFF